MKVIFEPPKQIFTGTPLLIKVEGVDDPQLIPLLRLSSQEKIPLHCQKSECTGHFTLPEKGEYELLLFKVSRQNSPSRPVWSQKVRVEEATTLSFKEEMGLFAPLLFVILTGLILWTIKHHHRNRPHRHCHRHHHHQE